MTVKDRSICRRCHRLRVVDKTRHCAICDVIRREEEKPRSAPPKEDRRDTIPSPGSDDTDDAAPVTLRVLELVARNHPEEYGSEERHQEE